MPLAFTFYFSLFTSYPRAKLRNNQELLYLGTMKALTITLLILSAASPAWAQRIEYPEQFRSLLNQAKLEFFEPLDAGYKDVQAPENQFQNCHFAIRSRQEDLEIRFSVFPWSAPADNLVAANPHILTHLAVSNVAVNDPTALISGIELDEESLRQEFNADWGMVYFFKPKPEFSDQPFCRMVALCKEEQATVLVFFLFDDAGNTALDHRYLALRFL